MNLFSIWGRNSVPSLKLSLSWVALTVDLGAFFLFTCSQWGHRCCSSCNCDKVLNRCSQASNIGKLVPLVCHVRQDLRTYTTRKGRAQGRSSRSDRRSGASGRAAGARPDQWLIFQEIFTIYYLLVSFIFILNSRSLLLPLVWTDGHICCKPWDEEIKQ